MSMVGAARAPDTAAAPVLGDDPLHRGKGSDRRRWSSLVVSTLPSNSVPLLLEPHIRH